jgi:hypothetical protein
VIAQHEFRREFRIHRNRAVPSAHAIKTWVWNFEATGSTIKKKGGSVKTVSTSENIVVVRQAIERSPQRSARCHSVSLWLSEASVRWVLYRDLHLYPYKKMFFQQDRAMSRTAWDSMAAVRNLFPNHVISRYGDMTWPARSPELSACDLFLWGYLKSQVFKAPAPHIVQELKHWIQQEVKWIPVEMLQRVMGDVHKRLTECLEPNGGHMNDVIFGK